MKFINHITPQLDEMVNDLFFDGYTPDELNKKLNNKLYWWDEEIFRKEKFNWNRADQTFVAWLNVVEILGLDVEAFNAALIEAIRASIESQWEIRMQEQEEDYLNELRAAV